LEFQGTDGLENSLHVCFVWNGIVDDMEFGENTSGDLCTTTAWFTHSRQELQILNVVWNDLESVIPELIVNPLPHELKWWLGTECVLSWHVKIIDEADSLLLGFHWSVFVFGSSLEVAFNDILNTIG